MVIYLSHILSYLNTLTMFLLESREVERGGQGSGSGGGGGGGGGGNEV